MPADDGATVLLVDDERSIVDLYALRLNDEYRVKKAYSGHEALEQMGDEIDVVLLDRRMPDIRGDEVLAEIREHGHDCRVAMVTAVDPSFDVLEMGFDAYVVKPVPAEDLNDTVDRLLQRDAYDDDVNKLLSLAARLATIEDKKDARELEASTLYRRLTDEFDELRDRLADKSDQFEDELGTVYRRPPEGQ